MNLDINTLLTVVILASLLSTAVLSVLWRMSPRTAGVGEPQELEQTVDRLRNALNGEIRVNGLPIALNCSLGASLSPHDGQSAQELLIAADRRMYADKPEPPLEPSPVPQAAT